MAGRLDRKVAIVTGAASGFGRAISRLFAAEGAAVVVGDLDGPRGQETADLIADAGGRAELVVGDVGALDVATELTDRAVSAFGRLDVLVNNAGIQHADDSWRCGEALWDEIMRVNLRSVFVCCQAAIPTMLGAGGGSIVNISSIAASTSIGGPAYAASKGGMVSYTHAVAEALAPQNIRVNCVAPGIMRTPMSTGERLGFTPEEQDANIASLGRFPPMGRCGSVDDIANAVLFLAGDEAKYVTGQELVVDGGYLVRGMMAPVHTGG